MCFPRLLLVVVGVLDVDPLCCVVGVLVRTAETRETTTENHGALVPLDRY
jgi:hypothetical protein